MIIIPKDPESPHLPDRTSPLPGSVTDRWGRPCRIAAGVPFPLAALCSACRGQIVLASWEADWQHAAFTADQPGYPRRAS